MTINAMSPEENLKLRETEHAEAEAAVAKARERFYADETESNRTAVEEAQKKAAAKSMYLESAKRKLEQSEIERKAAERAELERRKAELEALTSANAVLALIAPLAQREADHLKQLGGEIRLDRLKLAANVRAQESELFRIRIALGEEPEVRRHSEAELAYTPQTVCELLEQHIATLEAKDPARELLRALLPTRESYFSSKAP